MYNEYLMCVNIQCTCGTVEATITGYYGTLRGAYAHELVERAYSKGKYYLYSSKTGIPRTERPFPIEEGGDGGQFNRP
jgi:hypothetical protein